MTPAGGTSMKHPEIQGQPRGPPCPPAPWAAPVSQRPQGLLGWGRVLVGSLLGVQAAAQGKRSFIPLEKTSALPQTEPDS